MSACRVACDDRTGAHPYFMRTITDSFIQMDPLTGKAIDWMDWKVGRPVWRPDGCAGHDTF